MHTQELLLSATAELSHEVRTWLACALWSGRHRIAAFVYENDFAVCPVVAAAKEAGIWHDGSIAPGHPDWGNPDGPSERVEDFAAYFDLYVEEYGIDVAVTAVREALETQLALLEAA